ncbi:hypothetical protein [Nocardia otitidiscaviarum]|uniref:Uncharacterized protein n=1 Tax=Nocardia otitidiscaviarum TaxID=1823 RepID=A0A516NG58_9NOCA|nr:hypothetical protein [Nocardia otitidiscaviarum]MBF6178119.1 hypothetical protein [Nocardia otitidiscaviarum]MCP9623245.1 hypothetical protein [Nocardia otitidiscaviarum]QDP77888.1 hypothetical protein FOH10_03110 [Nocardia otitidiscaviarum]
MRVVRGLSGVVAGGTAVLAATVLGAGILGARKGFPGPGVGVIAWHIAAAVLAVGVQVYADRRRTWGATLVGAVIVLATVAALLWTQWWD